MLFKCHGVSYIPGTEDVPVMEGILCTQETPSLFDTEKGRVVISKVVSSLKDSEIENFYRQILSNLGWSKLSKNKYKRESQVLDIKIESEKGKTFITFELVESH